MTKTLYDQSNEDVAVPTVGSLLAPLFTWRGRDVYPVFGAEGEEDGDGDSDSESDADTDDNTGEGDAKDGSETVTREEFEKLRKQLSAADKNKSAAEKKLKEIEDAKKDELTKATEQVEELIKQNAAQAKELADMRLQNAFLSANTGITWHDPADALDIAERRGYLKDVVGEDGQVDTSKLSSKLKELAKAKPNLVKDGGDNKNKEEPKTPTGTKVGSKGTGSGTTGSKIPDRYAKFLNR
jgi:hypothetical protein